MDKAYPLLILTPERKFFEGNVYSLTVETVSGQMSVLKNHIPMVTALTVGIMRIRDEKGERFAFHSEGYMEVKRDCVYLFSQVCEWPEEIDIDRAKRAAARAQERLKDQDAKRNAIEHTELTLLRAHTRMRLKEQI